MPSRKRIQGRARKAKAAAGGAASVREPWSQPGECRHGCTLHLPRDHVCNAFVETCYGEWDKAAAAGNNKVSDAIPDGMIIAFKKYPINDSGQERAKSRFLEDGVK